VARLDAERPRGDIPGMNRPITATTTTIPPGGMSGGCAR
jgi:hypothetical protein